MSLPPFSSRTLWSIARRPTYDPASAVTSRFRESPGRVSFLLKLSDTCQRKTLSTSKSTGGKHRYFCKYKSSSSASFLNFMRVDVSFASINLLLSKQFPPILCGVHASFTSINLLLLPHLFPILCGVDVSFASINLLLYSCTSFPNFMRGRCVPLQV